MINWHNRQQRVIIIGSLAIIFIAVLVLLFLWFTKKPVNNFGQPTQNNPVEQNKINQTPPAISEWREKETLRLSKADHDKAIYEEIKASGDFNRCSEMQGLNVADFCFADLAIELKNETICEKIVNEEIILSCKDNFKK